MSDRRVHAGWVPTFSGCVLRTLVKSPVQSRTQVMFVLPLPCYTLLNDLWQTTFEPRNSTQRLHLALGCGGEALGGAISPFSLKRDRSREAIERISAKEQKYEKSPPRHQCLAGRVRGQ